MRIISGVAVAAMLLLTSFVQGQTLEEKYQAKTKKDFMKKIEWVDSLEKAQAIAKKSGKPIFGYFTRSYSP